VDVGLDPTLPTAALRRRDGVNDSKCQRTGESERVSHGGNELTHAERIGISYRGSREVEGVDLESSKVTLRVVLRHLGVERSPVPELNLCSGSAGDMRIGDDQSVWTPDDSRTATHLAQPDVDGRTAQNLGGFDQLVGHGTRAARERRCNGCHGQAPFCGRSPTVIVRF
jgi:hypothetical protein